MIDLTPDATFPELLPLAFADKARVRMDDIWAEVVRIMELSRQMKADPREAMPWLRAIDELTAELRMVGLTIGLLSPWASREPVALSLVDLQFYLSDPSKLPSDPEEIRKLLATLPESERQELFKVVGPRAVAQWREISSVTRFSPTDAAYKFPRIEEGVKFLEQRNVVTKHEWEMLAEREKVRTVYLRGTSQAGLEKLRASLAQSFRDGESLDTFRKRLGEEVTASKWEVETVYRTATKQAYLDGVTTILQNPRVGKRFPYVQYMATTDNRTRKSHAEWDGKIIAVDSPEYATAKALQAEYNCRCTLIPLTESRAKTLGLEE